MILLDRGLIKITGSDALVFLQSQLTNNIKKIEPGRVQINAYCQHQGKIIALLWVFKKDENFYLSLPKDLTDKVISRLNIFKMMSDIQIEDMSELINQYGLLNEKSPSYKIDDNLSIFITREIIENSISSHEWDFTCVKNKLPEIYLNTSERIVPQSLNLDINERGVSFTKGCYPGQEVVARLHYLGKSKKRLFRFKSKFEVKVGDKLNTIKSISVKPAGEVIRATKFEDWFYSLAIFEVSKTNENIFLINDQNKKLTIIHD